MLIKVVRDGPVAIIELDGLIDTRASQQFEKQAATLLGENVCAIVVDFSKVPLITSAGIRVLFMMGQRLHSGGGGLALCSLSERVRSVFEVAKLLSQFRVTATRQEAVAQVMALVHAPAATAPPQSKLTRLVSQTLADDGPEPEPAPGEKRSALSSLVLTSLTRDDK